MSTVDITWDKETVEDIERAVSAGLDSDGIDCTYNVKEVKE